MISQMNQTRIVRKSPVSLLRVGPTSNAMIVNEENAAGGRVVGNRGDESRRAVGMRFVPNASAGGCSATS